jgi:hypothetical protein
LKPLAKTGEGGVRAGFHRAISGLGNDDWRAIGIQPHLRDDLLDDSRAGPREHRGGAAGALEHVHLDLVELAAGEVDRVAQLNIAVVSAIRDD